MYERPEVLTGLDIDEEDRHHQVETGGAEADSVDCRVAHQHFAVAAAVRLVAHHVEERHLQKQLLLFQFSFLEKITMQCLNEFFAVACLFKLLLS